jgi:hypothetical protein
MQRSRRKSHPHDGNAGPRRHLRVEPPLSAASLGSPIFVESWNGGSPLNWVEFISRWENTRVDHLARKQKD